ncbi:DUF6933 domain-containing protein [Polaribacter butkevichii]|uniref:DUF6933 domain-containing protein n=1 Tax=Polaribacter butkevichii TaxID=218490 RepID=A0A2P6CCY3_9FLAO|nr:hypothetical protein [Polaribacter butkevichii]PQJ72718.1 hypothetical protein BTO14_05355 [Polaribacter butkevichii]
MTHIFTTKKLEKIIHKKINKDDSFVENKLGNWNANVFFIAKKKCILFVNSKTFFSVVIPRFSVKDINNLDQLFIDNLHEQLLYENIEIDYKVMLSEIGEIKFNPTNNNRKTIGILTYNIEKMNYFKYDYPVFNNLVIREMTEKLNNTPFKQLDWKNSGEKMLSLLKEQSLI